MEEIDIHNVLKDDTHIYGYGLNNARHILYLDIDQICQVIEGEFYQLELVPSTIVFENVWNVSIQIDTDDAIIIDYITVEAVGVPRNADFIDSKVEYRIDIECLEGCISFHSIGGYVVKRSDIIISDKEYIGISTDRPIDFSERGDRLKLKMLAVCHNCY